MPGPGQYNPKAEVAKRSNVEPTELKFTGVHGTVKGYNGRRCFLSNSSRFNGPSGMYGSKSSSSVGPGAYATSGSMLKKVFQRDNDKTKDPAGTS